MKKFKCNIAFLSVLTAVLPSCLSYVNIIDKEDPKFYYWTNLSICCLEGSTYRFSAPLTNVQDRVSEYGFCYQSESDSVEYVVAENSVENIYTADVTIEKNYGKTYNVDFVMHNGLGDKRSIASSEFTVNPLSSFVQFDSIITLSYDRQSKEAIVELACAVDEIVDVSAWGITYGKTQDLTQNITTIESTGDFNGKISATIPECLPGEIYYIRPYVKDGEYYAYGDSLKYDVPELDPSKAYDLSEHGTANSYIVSSPGIYKFKSVKGNSGYPVGTVCTVEVLWESFGTSVAPNKGELVSKAEYQDDFVIFSIPTSFKEGNAVVAAKDSNGTILWSWHIWLTDPPGECVYINDAGIMMDRNLGAICGNPINASVSQHTANRESFGLLYQWGRKDPFLGACVDMYHEVPAASTPEFPACVETTEFIGTIKFAIEHPTTFVVGCYGNPSWMWGETMNSYPLWSSEKTIYDPCPYGWKIPVGGDNSIWRRSGMLDLRTLCGENGSGGSSEAFLHLDESFCNPPTTYPLCGFRYSDVVSYVSEEAVYNNTLGRMMLFTTEGSNGKLYLHTYEQFTDRARGYWACSVRCQKDQ